MSDRPAFKKFKPRAAAAIAASQAAGSQGARPVAGTSSAAGAGSGAAASSESSTRNASPAGTSGAGLGMGAGAGAGVGAGAGGSTMQRIGTGSSGGIRSGGSTPAPAGLPRPIAGHAPGAGVGGPSAARPLPAARAGSAIGVTGARGGAPPLVARTSTFQKFKPKVSASAAVKAEPGIKSEPGTSTPYGLGATSSTPYGTSAGPAGGARGGGPARGAARGRGATRGRGRGAYESVASGVFATARTRTNYRPARRGGGITAGVADLEDEGEVYSDDEGGPGGNVIDMGAISTQGESAPTALIRAGRETGKAKAESKDAKDKKMKEKAKRKKDKMKGKEKERAGTAGTAASDGMMVKPEPISPEKRDLTLAPEGDMDMDLYLEATPPGEEAEEVVVGDPDQGLDLSESEDEEEEETMQGDFVQAEGMEDPSAKIYLFQFPKLFPRYADPRAASAIKVEDKDSASPAPPVAEQAETLNMVAADGTITGPPADVAANGGAAAASAPAPAPADVKPDIKPDIKPNVAARAGARGGVSKALSPEGQVGKLVVMKSGKVKLIMGDDIVMNVSPGVPSTFLQHLVHLDTKHKALKVMGDINKHFTVQPDIDRLLHQLWLNDGVTPNDVRKQNFDRQADTIERRRAQMANGGDNDLNMDELNADYFG